MGDGLGDALAELDKDGLAGWARGGAFDGGGQLGLAVLQLGLDHIEIVLVLVADPVQAGGDGLDG